MASYWRVGNKEEHLFGRAFQRVLTRLSDAKGHCTQLLQNYPNRLRRIIDVVLYTAAYKYSGA
jgi:hypothetical protein